MKKNILLLALFTVHLGQGLFAQLSSEKNVLEPDTRWEFVGNKYNKNVMTDMLAGKIFKNTDVYKTFFVSAYQDLNGVSLRGRAVIPEPSVYDINGLQAYSYWTYVNGLEYDKEMKPIQGVTRNSGRAVLQVNDLRGVLEDVSGDFELNGKPIQVFKLAHELKDPTGLKAFEAFGHENCVAYLFTHDNKLPYRFLTRKEYLNMIKSHWQKIMGAGMTSMDESEKQMLDMIENTKKEYTGELRDNMLKELNTQLEQYRKRKGSNSQKLNSGVQLELDSIEYAFKHYSEEELNKPAIPKADDVYRGFITEKEGGYNSVVIDDSYFKKNLPNYAEQVFVMWYYYFPEDPLSVPFLKAIRDKFPYDKLKTLIDK
jgi:hypothetical protein